MALERRGTLGSDDLLGLRLLYTGRRARLGFRIICKCRVARMLQCRRCESSTNISLFLLRRSDLRRASCWVSCWSLGRAWTLLLCWIASTSPAAQARISRRRIVSGHLHSLKVLLKNTDLEVRTRCSVTRRAARSTLRRFWGWSVGHLLCPLVDSWRAMRLSAVIFRGCPWPRRATLSHGSRLRLLLCGLLLSVLCQSLRRCRALEAVQGAAAGNSCCGISSFDAAARDVPRLRNRCLGWWRRAPAGSRRRGRRCRCEPIHAAFDGFLEEV